MLIWAGLEYSNRIFVHGDFIKSQHGCPPTYSETTQWLAQDITF